MSIVSTASGTGSGAKVLSGTSMASPHGRGRRRAHPSGASDLDGGGHQGRNRQYRSAAVWCSWATRRASAARARAARRIDQVAGDGAQPTTTKFAVGINFGFEELKDDFSKKKKIKLHNNGSTAATFTVAPANPQGRRTR